MFALHCLTKQFFQHLLFLFVFGVADQATRFERIVLVIVHFARHAIFAVVRLGSGIFFFADVVHPFRITEAFGADSVAHVGFRVLAERILAQLCSRLFHRRNEAHTVQMCRYGKPIEVAKRRKNIDKLAHGRRFQSLLHSGNAHHHHHMRGLLEIGMFVPQPMVAKMPAVVAPYDNDGIVSNSQSVEFCEQPTDICIGVPAIIGRNGVEEIVTLALNDEEKALFEKSADAVRSTNQVLKEINVL